MRLAMIYTKILIFELLIPIFLFAISGFIFSHVYNIYKMHSNVTQCNLNNILILYLFLLCDFYLSEKC